MDANCLIPSDFGLLLRVKKGCTLRRTYGVSRNGSMPVLQLIPCSRGSKCHLIAMALNPIFTIVQYSGATMTCTR